MRDHIHGIQIIRFFAAAMVLFGHITHELNERPQFSDSHNDLLSPFFMAGGVDIFFVISGFIIFLVGHEQFAKPGAPIRFIRQRLIRIVPLYWLLTAAMIASIALFSNQVAHSDINLPLTLASFAFFPVENSYGHFYPVLMVGWTLRTGAVMKSPTVT